MFGVSRFLDISIFVYLPKKQRENRCLKNFSVIMLSFFNFITHLSHFFSLQTYASFRWDFSCNETDKCPNLMDNFLILVLGIH